MKKSRHTNIFSFAIALLIHALLFLFREPALKNQSVSAKDTITMCFQTVSIKNENNEEQKNPPQQEKPVKPKPLPKKKTPKQKSATPQKKPVQEKHVTPENSATKAEEKPGSVSSATMAAKMDTYLSLLRTKIERNKYYPRYSKKLNQQGTSTVKLVIAADGRLLNVSLLNTSGFSMLDKAALDAVRQSLPLPPPSDHGLGRIAIDIPLCYMLR